MNNTIRKITALMAEFLMLTSFSCGEDNEEISDSQESTSSSQEKIEITVATIYNDAVLDDAIDIFSRKGSNYNVTVRNYAEENTEDGRSEAVKRIQMDILSGNSPDIVYLPSADMISFIDNGYLADLYSLMEGYDGVKKKDFLPNVLEALEIDGRLPSLCIDYAVYTAAAKTENVGEGAENWSLQDAIDYFNSLSKDIDFIYDYQDSNDILDMTEYFIGKISRECVDFKSKTCNFGHLYIEALTFLNDTGEVRSNFPQSEWEEKQMSLINNKAIVQPVKISGFNSIMSIDLCGAFGGADITLVGYPSENGCGAITETGMLYGILGSSDNPDGAWEFMNTLFSKEIQTGYYSFPVIKEYLEETAHDDDIWNNFALKKPVQYLENEEITIDDKTVEKILDYIKNIKFDFYSDDKVFNIISEENNEVFGGKRRRKSVRICLITVFPYISARSHS